MPLRSVIWAVLAAHFVVHGLEPVLPSRIALVNSAEAGGVADRYPDRFSSEGSSDGSLEGVSVQELPSARDLRKKNRKKPSARNKKKKRPNAGRPHIILSIADDLGYYDLGYKNPRIVSPVLDQLAEDGIKLGRHYTDRFCSPSRSMIFGGLHPFRHGQQTDINLNPVEIIPCAVQKDITFVSEVLQEDGYATHLLGKWHLGHYRQDRTPTERGFDTFVGYHGGSTGMMDSGPNEKFDSTIFNTFKCMCGARDGDEAQQPPYNLEDNKCKKQHSKYCVDSFDILNNTAGQPSRFANEKGVRERYEYVDELIGEEAVRIIDSHDIKTSLFLVLSWASPHAPTMSPEHYYKDNQAMIEALDLSICPQKERLKFSGMIKALDEQHRLVVDALKKNKLWDHTLLIFLSDNGGHDASHQPNRQRNCRNSGGVFEKVGRNFPLRGGKFTWWEGGIRTLAFVTSPNPNIIPSSRRGTTWDGLVSAVDWPTTLLDAASIDYAELKVTGRFAQDSISFWHELKKSTPLKSGVASGPRKSLPVQFFGRRIVYMYIHPPTGALYKYMKGYPGYIRAYGYRHASKFIYKNDPGDLVLVPDELLPEDPLYDMIPEDKNIRHSCINEACLFRVDTDPQEMHDLIKDPAHSNARRIILALVQEGEKMEVDFKESGLCESSPVSLEYFMRNPMADKSAMIQARRCGSVVPWVAAGPLGASPRLSYENCPLRDTPAPTGRTKRPTKQPTRRPTRNQQNRPSVATPSPTFEPTPTGAPVNSCTSLQGKKNCEVKDACMWLKNGRDSRCDEKSNCEAINLYKKGKKKIQKACALVKGCHFRSNRCEFF